MFQTVALCTIPPPPDNHRLFAANLMGGLSARYSELP